MQLDFDLVRRLIREALLNAYDVLGVPQGASEDQIKAAWKKLALQHHPDRGGSHGKMVDINNAKDRLLNTTQLFRFGSNFKGYEDPNAAKTAAPPPRQPPPPPPPQARWQPPPRPNNPPPPPPGAGPAGTPDPARVRYYENTVGGSNKFWQCQMRGNVVHVKRGRIGSEGQTQTKSFRDNYEAMRWVRKMVTSKRDKGYVEATPRAGARPGPGAAPPPHARPAGAAPGAGAAPTGGKTYKVYGAVRGKVGTDAHSRSHYPHTRVKGKAYTKPGSRFHQNDRVEVNIDPRTGKAKVKGRVGNADHSQDWDPVTQEAVWRVIDRAVADYLCEVASR